MSMYWCGFNGFNQLNDKLNTNLDLHIYSDKRNNEDIKQVAFSWSTASVLTSIKTNKFNFSFTFPFYFYFYLHLIVCHILISASGQIIISGLVNKKIVNFEILNNSGYGPFNSVRNK